MDAATLSKAMGGSLSLARYEELLPAFNAAMLEANITNVNRAAHWVSQLGHESGGLRWMEEIWGPSAAQRGYEGRADLGNTRPGDGYRFRGRSPIQITGRGHYQTLSRWAHGKGLVPTSTFFVDNPDALSQPKYTFLGPVWYWTVARPNLNALCDADDLIGVTKAINGGTRNLADRRARLSTAKALGKKLLPTKGGSNMALYDIDMSQRFGFGGPRSTSGIQRVVIHTTENATGTPATNVANYQIRTETGSYHYIVDASGKRVRCNTDDWITWSTANDAGNLYGLNLSFTTYSANTRAQWLAQKKMLRAGATVVADWCKRHNIPVAKVTTGRGICGHADTRAFGGTDHTDPGPNFPWDVFLGYVREAQSTPTKNSGTTAAEEKDMNEIKRDLRLVMDQLVGFGRSEKGLRDYSGWEQLNRRTVVDSLAEVRNAVLASHKGIQEILAILKENKK